MQVLLASTYSTIEQGVHFSTDSNINLLVDGLRIELLEHLWH
jgi:hypothetical protein